MTATSNQSRKTSHIFLSFRNYELLGILLSLSLFLGLRLWALQAAPINRLFDEGVHLGLMKLLAEKHQILYQDCLFIHPPGIIWAGAKLWPLVNGDITLLRGIYVLFCTLLFLPVYAIASRVYDKKTAVLTLLIIAVTPGFSGWIGRNIMLEPPLNVVLYFAIALIICFPSRLSYFLSGAILGLAVLIKETAVLAGLSLIVTLLLGEQKKAVQKTGYFVSGFVPVCLLVFAYLAEIPHFWRDVVLLNIQDTYSLQGRFYELLNGFYQLPLQMTLGAIMACTILRRNSDRETKILCLYTLLCGFLMVFSAKRFYWRHIIYVMPVCSIFAAKYILQIYDALKNKEHRPAPMRKAAVPVFAFAALVNVISMALYFTHERLTFQSYDAALGLLKKQRDPVFTFDPLWVVAAGRNFPEAEFAIDSIYARQYGLISESQMISILRQCPTVLLNRMVVRQFSGPMKDVLKTEYQSLYAYGNPEDQDYVEVLARKAERNANR